MSENKFTPKQRLFIIEYLVDKNATRAAKSAGYSAKTARSIGAENLTKPYIWEAIEKGLDAQINQAGIAAEQVLQELKTIAFADGSYSSKLRALELFGKSLGLFKDKPTPQTRAVSVLDLLSPIHKDLRSS